MNTFTIGARLTFGFAFLLLLITVLAGTGVWMIDTPIQSDVQQAHLDTLRGRFILLALAAFLSGLVLSVAITRSVLRPIRQAMDLLQTDVSCNLTGQLAAHSRNEAEILSGALQQVSTSLYRVVSDVHSSSKAISQGSQQILSENTGLSQRHDEQAAVLADTAALTKRVTMAIRQNAEHAQHANTMALMAADVATRGGAIVSQVITTMDSINTSSTKVENIIGVIDSIAFQTNILALNAAVESARAGEAGRGFAVVASEVRSLAQRSALAAREIKELITTSVDATSTGNKLVAETGTTMTEIVDAIQRVTDIMDEMAAASQEQTADIEDINHSLAQIDQLTRLNITELKSSTTAVSAIYKQSCDLGQHMARFKTHQAATPPNPTTVTPLKSKKCQTSGSPAKVHTPSATRTATTSPLGHTPGTSHTKAPLPPARPVVSRGTFQTSSGIVEEWEEF